MASGFSLTLRYPNITSFNLGWLVRRYVHIASVYYPALIAIVLLFSTQGYDGNPFYVLGAHFLFLDWLLPGTAFSIISPAWFVIPLMAFYVLYPFINRFVKTSKLFYPFAFVITVVVRLLSGTLVSVNPLFFLADFCFGMKFAYEKSYWTFLPLILLAVVNPAMMIPFTVFCLFYLARNFMPAFLSGIAKYTFEIFLFHEAVVNVILKKWTLYDASVPVSLLSILVSVIIVTVFSKKINALVKPKPVTPAAVAQA